MSVPFELPKEAELSADDVDLPEVVFVRPKPGCPGCPCGCYKAALDNAEQRGRNTSFLLHAAEERADLAELKLKGRYGRAGVFTMTAAAKYMGISRPTLFKFVSRGDVPAEFMRVLVGGRRMFQNLDGLKAWYWEGGGAGRYLKMDKTQRNIEKIEARLREEKEKLDALNTVINKGTP